MKKSDTSYNIITDIPGKEGEFWSKSTVLCKPFLPISFEKFYIGHNNARRLADIATAIKLFGKRSKADAFITSGTLIGLSLALLQVIFFWNRRPHILIDCIWYKSQNKLRDKLFSYILRFASISVTKFVVWAKHEIQDYPHAFRVDYKKFVYVHFWHTLGGYRLQICDDGYVFAGGNWDRDYLTVLKIAQQLPCIPFVIGTTRPQQFDGYQIPSNVTVIGYSPGDFRQAMASCRIMLVPMVKGVLHSGGQQTTLNSMCLGKPTIAFGRKWAQDLIVDDVNGYIVDYEDVAAAVSIVLKLWNSPNRYKEISIKAQEEAMLWPPSRSLKLIYQLTLSEVLKKNDF